MESDRGYASAAQKIFAGKMKAGETGARIARITCKWKGGNLDGVVKKEVNP